MPFINITCPKCGGQAQIEAGRSAMCPYCACELNAAAPDPGFAFAEDMQFAENLRAAENMQSAQDVQFAQAPVQQPVQMQQPNAYASPQINPAQFINPAMQYQQPVQQFPPQQLEAARKKRRQWHFLNLGMLAVQAVVLLFAIGMLDYFYNDDLGALLIVAWLFSLPVCAILSGAMRPDEAYIDRKPLFKRKIIQGFMHFLISLPVTAATAGILYAILNMLNYMF